MRPDQDVQLGATIPPPPPPPPSPEAAIRARPLHEPPQAGELTPGWQWVLRLAWLGVFVGFSSVWKASRDIGLPTWWIGELSDPAPFYVSLLPFVAPTVMVVLTFGRLRTLPWLGLGAAAVTAAVAVGDLAPYAGLGIVELALAAAGAAVSVASFAGRYRRPAR